ncbi:hypothetical protein ZIOFF_020480 [Zingiber officinale]|uniref:Uncharacterized protein n=1 Tax=Zingiber officinale TaxID=94328 RepID=A0A8J5LGN1_ZINOF|nr:hypothetical protein ZIOFF_020480 [Zingiber officinale]
MVHTTTPFSTSSSPGSSLSFRVLHRRPLLPSSLLCLCPRSPTERFLPPRSHLHASSWHLQKGCFDRKLKVECNGIGFGINRIDLLDVRRDLTALWKIDIDGKVK